MTDERVLLAARRRALLERMKAAAKDFGGHDPVRRVHLVVSIDRLLQRLLATTHWGSWVVKGGYATQLRHPQEARFIEDVDLRIDADIGQALVRFKVDVSSRDAVVGELERHQSDPIVERLGLARATFPVYPVAQQFAEKLHTYTLPREGENTRAKDLADMVWLTTRHAFLSGALIDAGMATFSRRDEQDWPPALTPPPGAWARQYVALRRQMDLEPPMPRDAHEALVRFLATVLSGDRSLVWDPDGRAWEPSA
jgi:predicted nucleotidyltransferase component of viral defense system